MGLEVEKNIVTKTKILELVSPIEIFEAYAPELFVLNKPFKSDPSFVIHYKQGYYYFVDYGKRNMKGDAFEFVKLMTNALDFQEVLDDIDLRLNLGISKGQHREASLRKLEAPQENAEEKLIQVKVKHFDKDDLDYWNLYSLSYEDLKSQEEVKVYSVDRYWIDKKLYYINYGELCFAYHFIKSDTFKIYTPYSMERKWISNTPLKTMYGLNNIKKCKNGVIVKSVKDLLVTSKLIKTCVGSQNESMGAISDENVTYISENCDYVWVNFDSDDAGVMSSSELCSTYTWNWINVPKFFSKKGIKDNSDLVKEFGLEALEYHFKNKNLI